MNNRETLIKSLAMEFQKEKMAAGVHLNAHTYISSTGSLDCSADAIPLDTLEKTLKAICQYENQLLKASLTNKEAGEKAAYMKVARKCVEEVLQQKMMHIDARK